MCSTEIKPVIGCIIMLLDITSFQFENIPFWWSMKYADYTPAERYPLKKKEKKKKKKRCTGYDTKLHLILMLQF